MIPIDAYKIGSGGSKINQTCGFIHFLLADAVNLPMSTHKKIKSWLLFYAFLGATPEKNGDLLISYAPS